MGRRGAVEVPRGRLHRAVGRAARRRDRDAVVRQPALRPGRSRAPPRRSLGRRGRRPSDRRPTTAARSGSSAIVDGQGRAASYTGDELQRVGRPPHWRRLCGAGEHPRLGRDGRCARRDVRDERGQAARRTAPRLSRRRAGSRRRQPRAAVGGDPRRRARAGLRGALGRLRRSPGRRPRAAARGAPPSLRHPSGALRPDAALAVDRGRRRAPEGDRRPPGRPRLRTPRGLGGCREPRGARRRRGRRRPVRARRLRERSN